MSLNSFSFGVRPLGSKLCFPLLDENIESCKYDYQPVNGYFDVPDLPGIGQELSDKALKSAKITTLK